MGGKARTLFQTVLWGAALWATGGGAGVFAPYIQGVAVAYSAWAARDAAKRNRSALNAALQDRQIVIRSASAAKKTVYGQAFVSGVLTYHRTPRSKQDPWFWMVLSLPIEHRITSIDEIYFGDQNIGPLDANGYVTRGPFQKIVTNTQIFSGFIPAGNVVTVPGNPEDQGEDFTLQPGLTCSVGPVPGSSGWDADRRNVFASITGQRTVRIPGEVGEQFTLTVSYSFTRPYMRVWRFLGDPDNVAHQPLIDATVLEADKWTASDRLRGIPHAIFAFRVDPDVYPRDIEPISILVSGKAILNTRTGVSAFSRNSILCARDYAVAKCGILAGEFNLADNINPEANVCDEQVPVSNAEDQARYTCDVSLSSDSSPIDNLATILTSCDGNATYSGSTLDLYAGHYIEPVVAFDDSDLVSMPEVIKSPPRMELVNGVKVRFLDASQPFWPLTDAPVYLSPFYREQDGGLERIFEVELAATSDSRRAQRIGKQMLHRARAGLRVRVQMNVKAFRISPEQTIWLSLRSLGFDEKPFRVKAIKPIGPVTVELLLQEDGPLLYAWNFNEAFLDAAPNTSLQSARIVQNIQGLGADTSVNAAASGPNGELVSQCRVFWQPIHDPLVLARGRIEARHKRAQDTGWSPLLTMDPTATEFRFNCKRGDLLTIQVRAANSLVAGYWGQIIKLADDSPTQYLTGNLLPNARLEVIDGSLGAVTVPGWSPPISATDPATVTDGIFRRLFIGSSDATGVRWRQDGTTIGKATYVIVEKGIPVFPGDRMSLFGLVNGMTLPDDPVTDMQIGVNLYNAAGTVVDQQRTSMFRAVAPASEGIQTFGFVGLFLTVPSDAVTARPFVWQQGIGTGTTSTPTNAGFTRPFFGRASAGQVAYPPWSA